MRKISKKGIGPVVATTLLILVAVSAFMIISNWFNGFQSDFQTGLISKGSIELEGIKDGSLYVRNNNPSNLTYSQLKINGVLCNLTGQLLPQQYSKININNCTSSMNIGPKEVVLITDVGVYTKTLMLKSVTFTSQTPSSGSFSGYSWGEQFGYISFNGTGYQVLMSNNQLYGKAYSENLGYISFNGSNYGVTNVNGVLTGFAYGENIGFINFNNSPTYQTTFNGTNLEGDAYSENFGYINFNYPTLYNIIYN